MPAPATLVWFRQDLRLEDNPALDAAVKRGGTVIPVYIWAPEEEGGWAPGGASKWWLHHSLASLEGELRKIGLQLVIRQGPSREQLEGIAKASGANAIVWNRRYEPWALQRDAKVKKELHAKGYAVETFNGSLLFEPWTISNKQNKRFQVFTPFWKHCSSLPQEKPLKAPVQALGKKIESLPLEELGLLPRIHWDAGIAKAWEPGAPHAKKSFDAFLKENILQYHELRNRPDLPGVSRMSPHLHFGEVSPRMLWRAILEKYSGEEEGVACYLRELGWREFAYHLVYHFPKTVDRPLREEFAAFPWREDVKRLKAWQKGMTGYPIVDAGMRELWTTGWMHNRVRMIVGSFLVKDLRIHWLEGAKWFWDTLVDADMANNTLGWQWVAGCGADAAPYFRIFNPTTQGKKFDPEGAYVRKWVPELASGKTYPHPIVDHKIARDEALQAFKQRKKETYA